MRHRKVDLGLRDFVDVVGPGVQGDVLHDLDDLSVVVTRHAHGADVRIGYVTALAHHLGREAHRGVGLRVERAATPVGGDLGIAQLREVLAQRSVRRQAVVAAVDLSNRERDALARLRRQAALGQGTGHCEISLQRCRAVGRQAEEVRDRSDLFVNGFEQPLRRSRRGVDVRSDGEAGHGADSSGLIGPGHPVESTVDISASDN